MLWVVLICFLLIFARGDITQAEQCNSFCGKDITASKYTPLSWVWYMDLNLNEDVTVQVRSRFWDERLVAEIVQCQPPWENPSCTTMTKQEQYGTVEASWSVTQAGKFFIKAGKASNLTHVELHTLYVTVNARAPFLSEPVAIFAIVTLWLFAAGIVAGALLVFLVSRGYSFLSESRAHLIAWLGSNVFWGLAFFDAYFSFRQIQKQKQQQQQEQEQQSSLTRWAVYLLCITEVVLVGAGVISLCMTTYSCAQYRWPCSISAALSTTLPLILIATSVIAGIRFFLCRQFASSFVASVALATNRMSDLVSPFLPLTKVPSHDVPVRVQVIAFVACGSHVVFPLAFFVTFFFAYYSFNTYMAVAMISWCIVSMQAPSLLFIMTLFGRISHTDWMLRLASWIFLGAYVLFSIMSLIAVLSYSFYSTGFFLLIFLTLDFGVQMYVYIWMLVLTSQPREQQEGDVTSNSGINEEEEESSAVANDVL